MKKITLFLLFTLPILRGGKLAAQDCKPFYYYTYQSFCNAPAAFSIISRDVATNSFIFRLDGVTSTTNIWQNVATGRHTIAYSNSCTSGDTIINLTTSNLSVFTEQQPLRSCSDTVYSFKIKVVGGRPPYNFSIDNGAATTDSIAFLSQGPHFISVVDALGCRSGETYDYVYYRRDSVRATTSFTPSGTCGNVGTLTIVVNDARVLSPYSISLNGLPFSSSNVFRNVVNTGYLPYIVKSADGCLYYGTTPYYYSNILEVTVGDSCANRLGFGTLKSYAIGGVKPYKYQWSNGSTNQNLDNVRIGTYKVFVTDANNCQVESEKTLTTCVWAGDTDTSGVVNASDLLNIGLAFGERGNSRPYCAIDSSANGATYCTSWQPFNVPFWSKQTPTNVNYKHIDANGNGLINHSDTLAITRNWNKTRSLRGDKNENPTQLRGAAPPIYVQTGNVAEGKWASFPVMLGDATNAANGVYGLAFMISYDPSVIDASTVYLSFGQNWLGSGDNVLRIFKNFDGVIEAAISRTNQQNASGNGQIATLNFKTKAGTKGRNLSFDISNQQVINRDAQNVPTVIQATSTTVLTGTSEPEWASQIEVYPNPTTGDVIVEGQNKVIFSVEVFDISGKSLFKTQNVGKSTPLSIEGRGTYFLKIQTESGVLMRRLVKL
jgi:hypothetical protein